MIGNAVFVARQAEMERLDRLLAKALAGQGQVCFVAGEAGAGKSTLVAEFTRRAQERHPDLLMAFGDSNAQTGVADPYLPFREVMALLTGDVEGSLAEGVITHENALRLRRFLSFAGEALVEGGADLIGIFVPGGALLTRMGARWAKGSRWVGRLEALVRQKTGAPAGPQARLDQNQIFEQYTSVIRRLAAQAPLVLVIDDLHWVDAASMGLLFHLARRLEKSRVLIVGTFRPNDVALGRGGERHPLEPVLNELKRYYGDVVIDLGEADEAEGRAFVDALLDAEPNRLGPEFRDALYRHTEGHPLFTVELLRSLQERGVLVPEDGVWALGPAVDWESLPARVDGVIGERIGRLETELRETLTVASVEGHHFTAEVVARVRAADERGVIRRLSGELERQHRLVAAQGTQRLPGGRLSYYRFRHSLFQRWLYAALGEAERSYLHEDVARVLVELYGDQCNQIAVQLARHFLEAGDTAGAVRYHLCAGDTAAAAYANAEARHNYAQALELLEAAADADDDDRRARIDTTLKLVSASYVAEAPERSLERLAAAEALAAALPDPECGECGDRWRLARIRYWMGRFHFMANAPREAIGYYRQVLEIARERGDEEMVAIPSSVMGRALVAQGHFARALPLLEEAVAPMERLGNVTEWISTHGFLGVARAATGRHAAGTAAGEAGIRRAVEINSPTALAISHTYFFAVHLMAGDVARMLETSADTIQAAERSGDRLATYVGHGYRAWAEARAGNPAAAEEHMARCREVGRSLGPNLVIADWFAAVRAEMALRAGRLDDAAALAEEAVAFARGMGGIFAEGVAQQVWGEALAAMDPPRTDEAEEHFAAAGKAFEAGGALLPLAHLRLAWGRILLERGRAADARPHLEAAAAQFEASGLAAPLAAARALLPPDPAPAAARA